MFTAQEIAQNFDKVAAARIISGMKGASAITAQELSRILGVGQSSAIGLKDAFNTTFNDMKSAAKISVDDIQGFINGLEGTTITNTINNVTKGGSKPPGYASGTGGRFLKVPPGYPNDSFPILMKSGEDFMVRTPADQRKGITGLAGGQGADLKETNDLLKRVLRGLGETTGAVKDNTKHREKVKARESRQGVLREVARA